MQRTLSRNKKFEGGMLFGGTTSGELCVWIERRTYEEMGKPTRIVANVTVAKPKTKVIHTHETTYG